MSITTILPLVEALPHIEKFQLMQVLLTQLANEEGVSLQTPTQQTNQGQKMAAILQRMADRNALSQITDPVAWQREIRAEEEYEGLLETLTLLSLPNLRERLAISVQQAKQQEVYTMEDIFGET